MWLDIGKDQRHLVKFSHKTFKIRLVTLGFKHERNIRNVCVFPSHQRVCQGLWKSINCWGAEHDNGLEMKWQQMRTNLANHTEASLKWFHTQVSFANAHSVVCCAVCVPAFYFICVCAPYNISTYNLCDDILINSLIIIKSYPLPHITTITAWSYYTGGPPDAALHWPFIHCLYGWFILHLHIWGVFTIWRLRLIKFVCIILRLHVTGGKSQASIIF